MSVTCSAIKKRSLIPSPRFALYFRTQGRLVVFTSPAWIIRNTFHQLSNPSEAIVRLSTESRAAVFTQVLKAEVIGSSVRARTSSAMTKRSIALRSGPPSRTTLPTTERSSASLVNQPAVSKLGAMALPPSSDTRPKLGRIPHKPQKEAGIRTDPPVSEPTAKSDIPAVIAAAEPEDDPPGNLPGARKFIGVP